MSSSVIHTNSSDVFEMGTYGTKIEKVEPRKWKDLSRTPPPKPLMIASPTEEGDFPLLLFLHGYMLFNSFYSQLLQHIASHGFIVISPQLYCIAGADTTEEIRSAAAVTNWLSTAILPHLLPPDVRPDLSKVALSGHSRGGKTAFALSLQKPPNLTFSALVGIDPVDGTNRRRQTPPPVLTHVPRTFDPAMAVLIIGSGLGRMRRYGWFPESAPEGVNHEAFFEECRGPGVDYLVARGYGHLDMLDEKTKGMRGRLTYWICENGESRGPMRRFVGGAVVAFLKACLDGDGED